MNLKPNLSAMGRDCFVLLTAIRREFPGDPPPINLLTCKLEFLLGLRKDGGDHTTLHIYRAFEREGMLPLYGVLTNAFETCAELELSFARAEGAKAVLAEQSGPGQLTPGQGQR